MTDESTELFLAPELIPPKSYSVLIKCHFCGKVQKAKVLRTKPYPTKSHDCIACGHNISESNWDEVYTQNQQRIICPHCGHEFAHSAEWSDYDGEDIECTNCDGLFHLSVEQTVEYSTQSDCELNDDEHEWRESTSGTSETMIFYNCSKCDMTKYEYKEEIHDSQGDTGCDES